MEITKEQAEEYQSMKLNYQKFKEDSFYYEGLTKKIIRVIPDRMLIEEAKRRKLIKRNWEIK